MVRFLKLGFKTMLALLIVLLAVIFLWPEKAYEPYTPPADYRERAAAYPVPSMPADWTYQYFTASDGTKIRWGSGPTTEGQKASLVFIPGYTGTLEMYGDVVAQLSERGYHVIGYDIRGQGGSDRHRPEHPEKLYVKDFSVYGNDLAGFMDALPADLPKPRMIMASSFGGAVAVRAAGDHALKTDALLLLAPAFEPNTAPYSIAQIKLMSGLAKLFGKSKRFGPGMTVWQPDSEDMTLPSDCSSNPDRLYLRDVIYTQKPELRVGNITNNWLSEIIENGEIVTQAEYMKSIDMPVTTIAAFNDVIINNDVTKAACTDGFPNCKLVVPAGTGHCLTLEDDIVFKALWDEADALLERIQPLNR